MKRFLLYGAMLVAMSTSATDVHAGFSRGGGFTAAGYGARAWGMAGAAVAYGSDEAAAFWNPALLSLLEHNQLGLSYIDLIAGADAQQSYVAYAHVLRRGVPEEPGLEFVKHSLGAIYGNLRLELADGQNYSENTVRLAYAYSPQYFVTFGAAFNVLLSSSDIVGFDAKGTAVDFGVRLRILPGATLGAVVRNAFSKVDFDDGFDQTQDRSLTVGLAVEPSSSLVIEGDIVGAFGGIARLVIGGEYRVFQDALAVRGGIAAVTAGENRAIPHVGIGLHVRQFRIDYNANLDENTAFENAHRFALGVGF